MKNNNKTHCIFIPSEEEMRMDFERRHKAYNREIMKVTLITTSAAITLVALMFIGHVA